MKPKKTISFMINKIMPQNLALIGLIAIILIAMQIAFPLFLTPLNVNTMIMNFIIKAFLAIGMTFVIITGGIDLSVSSVLPFAGILCAKMMLQMNIPMWPAIIITLIVCTMIGAINGILIDVLKVHPMIITMAMMLFLRGVNLTATNGTSISGFSDAFLNIGQGDLFGINIPILVFVLLVAFLSISLNHHRFFRQIYFIGGNKTAAELSGINVKWVLIFFYMLSAFIAGLAGVISASKYGTAQWGDGYGFELIAISAVAIGGANLNGGVGKLSSTVLGAIFLAILNNAFVMANVNVFWFDVLNGVMLIVALLFSYLVNQQNNKHILNLKHERMLKEYN